MGVYAMPIGLLISLLILVDQTVWISALPTASSLEHGSLIPNSNLSTISSLSLQHYHQDLVQQRGGGEEKRTVAGRVVMKSKGGRSGGLGGSNINHRPANQNKKNAASSLFDSSFAAKPAGLVLVVLFFLMSF